MAAPPENSFDYRAKLREDSRRDSSPRWVKAFLHTQHTMLVLMGWGGRYHEEDPTGMKAILRCFAILRALDMMMMTVYRAAIYPCCNSRQIALERPWLWAWQGAEDVMAINKYNRTQKHIVCIIRSGSSWSCGCCGFTHTGRHTFSSRGKIDSINQKKAVSKHFFSDENKRSFLLMSFTVFGDATRLNFYGIYQTSSFCSALS